MTGRHPLLSALGATLLGASFVASCASPTPSTGTPGTGGATGAAGSNPQGAAGTTGAAGSNPQGHGGTTGAAGSNPQGVAGTTGTGGSNPQGAAGTTGTAGSNPQGAAGTTGTGGSNPQGAAGTTGTAGRGGTTGAAGSNPQGVAGTTGAGGGGNPNCPLASANIISDFEEGTTAVTVKPTGGIWYAYKGMGTITPAPVAASTTPMGIATATDGTGTCKGALHVVASGATDYSGFGATFAPMPTSSQTQFAKPYDVSAHKGISFKIKSGSGTPSAIYFGFKTRETSPMAEGGTLSDAAVGSSNPDTSIGLRNNRGQILVSPWTSPSISTSWQTITIPFSTLISRWVPAAGSSNACPPPTTAGVAKCQAPKFNPANVLALEFGVFPDPGFPKPATVGTYDVWVDDVQFVDDDTAGIATTSGFPLSGAGSPGPMCTKPNGYDGKPVDGKYLVSAYNQWKATFVQGGKVIRPENGNDTVSEGIAYGMLLAVNFNDKTTFDSLYSYWKSHKAAGGTPGLMTWCITNGGSNNCSSSGGSATDADEDAAFALLQAGKVFGTASYTTDAKSMISDIWANDIDTANNLPKGGNQYARINPSYFAPAYYRVFAQQDSGHAWGTVADKTLSTINGIAGSYGLLPAWCNSGCTGPDGSGNDILYQYDSHRIPMRVGLDYCWNGTAAAKTYVDKVTSFFATNAQAGKDGIGRISDLYNTSGSAASGSAPNSASIIGTAAVGAMASGTQKAFLDDAYQAVFDMSTRGTMAPPDSTGKTPYSYYNATVGLLTLLMMTGNFSH
jgi:endo-1,4-beta-D-glucanase Y